MKKLIKILSLLLVLSMLSGCAVLEKLNLPFKLPFGIGQTQEPEEPLCGGVTDNSDPDAPKSIRSTQITKFDCYFSTTTSAEAGALGRGKFWLSAEKSGSGVNGSVHIEKEQSFEKDFTADASFMDQLQELAYGMFDMAQYNGKDYFVAGLPEDFGATLRVDYASGETIRAYDNQSNYLSYGFMSALVDFFTEACATVPTAMNVRVENAYLDEAYGFAAYPVISSENAGLDALSETLSDISAAEQQLAKQAAENFSGGGEAWLYYDTETIVTRCDSEYVSFYVKSESYESADWDEPVTQYRGYTIETETGKQLGFSDILREQEQLPAAIITELAARHPDAELIDGAFEELSDAVEYANGEVGFALAYGHLHVFLGEYLLSDELGAEHLLLPFVDCPSLLSALFMTEPEAYIMPIATGLSYKFGNSFRLLRCDWNMDEESYEGEWTLSYCEQSLTETYFGYAPDCRLVKMGEAMYLYARVPSGDVSMYTDIYALTEDGAEKIKRVPMAFSAEGCNDPEQMKMELNDIISSSATMLLPSGFYRVAEDGLPEQLGKLCTLTGGSVKLKESGRYNAADPEQAAGSGGMWNLTAGDVLTPLQTDRQSFIDFITEDGRVVRFSIDKFSDDMQLDNFGTLDDVFDTGFD